VFALAFAVGMAHGNSLRAALTDLRFAMLPIYLVVLAGVSLPVRGDVLRWGVSGFLVWAGVNAVLFAVEPSGFCNPNVTPISVPMFIHSLHLVWLFPVLAMSTASSGLPVPRQAAFSGIAWFFVWLSYLRALWLGWPVAVLAGIPAWWVAGGFRATLRFVAGQALGFALGTAIVIGYLGLSSGDGLFLLGFRAYTSAHAVRLVSPPMMKFEAPAWTSVTLRWLSRTGRLFSFKGVGDRAGEDASASDRQAMAQRARKIFLENPVLGGGLGITYRYSPVHGRWVEWNNPHNGYWWWLSKTGLLGSLVILLIGLWSGINVWHSRRFPGFVGLSVTVGALFLFCEMLNCGFGIHTVVIPLAVIAVFKPGYESTRARP
jgi:hypothetical protein